MGPVRVRSAVAHRTRMVFTTPARTFTSGAATGMRRSTTAPRRSAIPAVPTPACAAYREAVPGDTTSNSAAAPRDRASRRSFGTRITDFGSRGKFDVIPILGMIIPEMGKQIRKAAASAVASALFTPVQQRVLGILFVQPERRFQSAELIRLADSGTGAVHRELLRLD